MDTLAWLQRFERKRSKLISVNNWPSNILRWVSELRFRIGSDVVILNGIGRCNDKQPTFIAYDGDDIYQTINKNLNINILMENLNAFDIFKEEI